MPQNTTRIPGVQRPPWFTQQWVSEAAGSVPPLLSLVATAYVLRTDPTKPHWLGRLALAGIAWLLAASVIKVARARAEDDAKQHQESPDGLLGCTHVLCRILYERCGLGAPRSGKMRVTLYRIVPPAKSSDGAEPLDLEQVLPYVGGDGGPAGRRFSKRVGIAGYVVREKAPFTAQRQSSDYDAFLDELVQHWGYTRDEARRLTRTGRRGWPCRCSGGARVKNVIGVVFLDSSERAVFEDEGTIRLIMAACYGITQYIEERY